MQIPSKPIKLLFGSLCLALLGGLSAQAQYSGNTYVLTCENYGLCVNDPGNSKANGTDMIQYTYGTSSNEEWTFSQNSDGSYTIKNVYSGLVLDDPASNGTNGTKVDQWSSNGGANQKWWVTSLGNGYVEIRNEATSLVLDDPAGSSNGAQLDLWAWNGGSNQYWFLHQMSGGGGGGGGGGSGFGNIVSQTQFTKMFPSANQFYTYSGLVSACAKYPAFCTSGNSTQNAQEAAAFLANVAHETGGLVYINEIAQAPYCSGTSTPCGVCASGQEYYGRGPLQISWNYNYCACGQAIGQNLWANPNLVSTNATISWQTGLWYWMTQTGASSQTSHSAILGGSFGGTIKAINGGIECNGGNPSEVQDRLNYYNSFLQILGVSAGSTATGC